jgi:hypothetical protein
MQVLHSNNFVYPQTFYLSRAVKLTLTYCIEISFLYYIRHKIIGINVQNVDKFGV